MVQGLEDYTNPTAQNGLGLTHQMNEEVQDMIALSMKRYEESKIKEVVRTTVSSLVEKARVMAIHGLPTFLYYVICTATNATVKRGIIDEKLEDKVDELKSS